MRRSGLIRRAFLGMVLLAAGSGALGAAAADGVEQLRATGIAAYKSGDYAEAKKAFDEAFRLSPLHSLGVWGARTRVKLGEWVEADERYERLAKAPVTRGERSAEEEAKQ